jgi:hypothetical protein
MTNTLKCVDCLVCRMVLGKDLETSLDFITHAVTMIGGDAVCATHAERRLKEGAAYEKENDQRKRQIVLAHYRG